MKLQLKLNLVHQFNNFLTLAPKFLQITRIGKGKENCNTKTKEKKKPPTTKNNLTIVTKQKWLCFFLIRRIWHKIIYITKSTISNYFVPASNQNNCWKICDKSSSTKPTTFPRGHQWSTQNYSLICNEVIHPFINDTVNKLW